MFAHRGVLVLDYVRVLMLGFGLHGGQARLRLCHFQILFYMLIFLVCPIVLETIHVGKQANLRVKTNRRSVIKWMDPMIAYCTWLVR